MLKPCKEHHPHSSDCVVGRTLLCSVLSFACPQAAVIEEALSERDPGDRMSGSVAQAGAVAIDALIKLLLKPCSEHHPHASDCVVGRTLLCSTWPFACPQAAAIEEARSDGDQGDRMTDNVAQAGAAAIDAIT